MGDVEMANNTADSKSEKLPITVSKPTPYTFDLGNILVNDPNPLELPTSQSLDTSLQAIARDGTQSLLNQLLTTCQITSNAANGPPTKWELFARKKGIGKYSSKPGAALADKERRKNLVYDEASGEWVPKWGYKGKNKEADNQWLVEVDEKDWKKEEDAAAKGSSIRGLSRAERKEKIKRNERKMRANERRGKKN
ncbi:ribosome biogenesis protein [Penicillium citrinum]|uniref:Ribosome biogenesis regulatory protein n=1 Tax=Penicillium citrinum TaxID=5077 RepID=A0A9W9PDK2_PENCI|nr:ribosome biogenesis protein [Penicillium citrinum]KAJ5242537.1 ribosome biogenesis protein [Penicillium citrinum]